MSESRTHHRYDGVGRELLSFRDGQLPVSWNLAQLRNPGLQFVLGTL